MDNEREIVYGAFPLAAEKIVVHFIVIGITVVADAKRVTDHISLRAADVKVRIPRRNDTYASETESL